MKTETTAGDAIAELLKLIHGFVTGDGAQLENLDFDEAYWRGMAKDDHLDVSIHVENWLAMLTAMQLVAGAPPHADALPSKDEQEHPIWQLCNRLERAFRSLMETTNIEHVHQWAKSAPWITAEIRGHVRKLVQVADAPPTLLAALIEQAETWRATGDNYTAIQYEEAAAVIEHIARRFGARVSVLGKLSISADAPRSTPAPPQLAEMARNLRRLQQENDEQASLAYGNGLGEIGRRHEAVSVAFRMAAEEAERFLAVAGSEGDVPAPPPTKFDLLDDPTRGLHAVLTRYGIASRTDCESLVTALVHWAAEAYRSSAAVPPGAADARKLKCKSGWTPYENVIRWMIGGMQDSSPKVRKFCRSFFDDPDVQDAANVVAPAAPRDNAPSNELRALAAELRDYDPDPSQRIGWSTAYLRLSEFRRQIAARLALLAGKEPK